MADASRFFQSERSGDSRGLMAVGALILLVMVAGVSGRGQRNAARVGGVSSSPKGEAKSPFLNLNVNRWIYWLVQGVVVFFTWASGLIWLNQPNEWLRQLVNNVNNTLTITPEEIFGIPWSLIGFGLLLAVALTLRFTWGRYLTYKTQWWLGEVAARVHEHYDIDWSLIAQATRYLPIVWFGRYRLRVKEDWLDGSPIRLEISVPVKRGRDMRVTMLNAEGKQERVRPRLR